MKYGARGMFGILTALALMTALPAPAHAAPYRFTKVADSLSDGFHPFSFECSSINTRGDIAFRAGRLVADGFNTTEGIYRADVGGSLTTIVEDERRFDFIGRNPSMNDLGWSCNVRHLPNFFAVGRKTGEQAFVSLADR